MSENGMVELREEYEHLGFMVSGVIPIDLWLCRKCGSVVDMRAIPVHRSWHGA